jgi:DNA primase catalytic subunit
MEATEIIKYYLNDNVLEKLIGGSNREMVARYGEQFGRRPNVFLTKEDIEKAVREGATSFHISEERWQNPLELSTNLTKKEIDQLRIGWDLVIDIDSKLFEVSKIFAKLITKQLEKEGVKHYSIKFSGGSGFHILIPFEAFPSIFRGQNIKILFPEVPMVISNYLKIILKEQLLKELKESFPSLIQNDPYEIVNIDSVLINERHLIRMQYSLNEKKWLVSLPINKNKLESFKPEDATPGAISFEEDFFKVQVKPGEASLLLNNAYSISAQLLQDILVSLGKVSWIELLQKAGIDDVDKLILATPAEIALETGIEEKEINELIAKVKSFIFETNEEKTTEEKEIKIVSKRIIPELFPPCIKNIMNGLEDGRKRSLFILANFLRAIGMNEDEVERMIIEWNKRNKPPLKDSYVNAQLKYMKKTKVYFTPNCDAPGYYKYFGVCTPDETCKLIKNPLGYYAKKLASYKRSGERNVKDENASKHSNS